MFCGGHRQVSYDPAGGLGAVASQQPGSEARWAVKLGDSLNNVAMPAGSSFILLSVSVSFVAAL